MPDPLIHDVLQLISTRLDHVSTRLDSSLLQSVSLVASGARLETQQGLILTQFQRLNGTVANHTLDLADLKEAQRHHYQVCPVVERVTRLENEKAVEAKEITRRDKRRKAMFAAILALGSGGSGALIHKLFHL